MTLLMNKKIFKDSPAIQMAVSQELEILLLNLNAGEATQAWRQV